MHHECSNASRLALRSELSTPRGPGPCIQVSQPINSVVEQSTTLTKLATKILATASSCDLARPTFDLPMTPYSVYALEFGHGKCQ